MFDVIQDWDSCLVEGNVATLRCVPIVLQNIINSMIVIAGIVCVFVIIYAGYKFVMSEGDPEKITSARKTIFYGIAGFILILLSFVLLNIIANLTGVEQIAPKP